MTRVKGRGRKREKEKSEGDRRQGCRNCRDKRGGLMGSGFFRGREARDAVSQV